jgi:MFS family permease
LLTITSFQPLYGKLSDIFGRKHALLFAYAVFGVGCLFCGLARNMVELIAARVRGYKEFSMIIRIVTDLDTRRSAELEVGG